MMKYEKAYEMRELMRKSVRNDSLISALFEDIPDLQSVNYTFTQEYDDNNYSDYVRLTRVNGHRVDYDGEYEEEEGEESEEPKGPKLTPREVRAVADMVDMVAKEWGYTYEDERTLKRENYLPVEKEDRMGNLREDEQEYLISYISKTEIPESWFVKKNPKWACYYAFDHGRFSEKTEFKLFAKKNRAREAYWYAFHVIKGRLPEPIENFFILSSMGEEDNEWIKKYMEFREKMVEA